MRGFGNNFKFPEATSSAAPAGNAGFEDDTGDDDNLYA